MDKGSDSAGYKRSWKTTLYAVLAMQGFGLVFGSVVFGAVVTSQPPSAYPVFGYGKPPPILIDGLSSFYWAIPGAIMGFVFLYLAMISRNLPVPMRSKMGSSVATLKTMSEKGD